MTVASPHASPVSVARAPKSRLPGPALKRATGDPTTDTPGLEHAIVYRRFLLTMILGLAPMHPSPAQPAPEHAARRGIEWFQQQHYTQAKAALESALRAGGNDPRLRYYLGRSCLELGDYGCAIEQLERATDASPGQADFHYWLARAYGAKAEHVNPFEQAWLAGRVRRQLERAVALEPKAVAPRVALANFYLQAPGFMGGGLTKAIRETKAVSALDPREGGLLSATIDIREENFHGAEARYRSLEQSYGGTPGAYDVYGDYGAFLMQRKRYTEAIIQFRKQAELAPTDPGPQLALGNAYRAAGNRQAAIAAYQSAVHLKPDLAAARKALEQVQRTSGTP
ncbi:MAG: hypothetical protein B7Z66_11480 [Chromatiales bacterium 21-64-14]|nr:MAG: hypothetical protein B7Z66_11480 [Chromatiales bacterium 21-64-14]HQU16728.1 tetratricopeptide repeat protein [Gammaproteobacteria bacterium]